MAHHQERSGDRPGVHGEFHGVHGGDEFAELDQRRRIVGHVHAGLHLRQPDLQQHLPADFDHKVRLEISFESMFSLLISIFTRRVERETLTSELSNFYISQKKKK